MPARSEASIAVRAYEIWEKQGRPHGRDREHWLQAAAELAKIEGARKPKPAVKVTPAAVVPTVKAAKAKAPAPATRSNRKSAS
jgi:hypothetical protein